MITGIAPSLRALGERLEAPSAELVFLARRALQIYAPKRLITCLTPGWEQALASAAQELEIPYTVVIPFENPAFRLHSRERKLYLRLQSRAASWHQLPGGGCGPDWGRGLDWEIREAGTVLALWNYEFEGDLFHRLEYAIQSGKTVVNLWEEWELLCRMRRQPSARQTGVQVFDHRK